MWSSWFGDIANRRASGDTSLDWWRICVGLLSNSECSSKGTGVRLVGSGSHMIYTGIGCVVDSALSSVEHGGFDSDCTCIEKQERIMIELLGYENLWPFSFRFQLKLI